MLQLVTTHLHSNADCQDWCYLVAGKNACMCITAPCTSPPKSNQSEQIFRVWHEMVESLFHWRAEGMRWLRGCFIGGQKAWDGWEPVSLEDRRHEMVKNSFQRADWVGRKAARKRSGHFISMCQWLWICRLHSLKVVLAIIIMWCQIDGLSHILASGVLDHLFLVLFLYHLKQSSIISSTCHSNSF